MKYTVTLDCGCTITLLPDGNYHRPTPPLLCKTHALFVGPFVGQLWKARVHVVADGSENR